MAKTIVLTGASDGIGAAAAGLLAERGHRMILVGRSETKLAAVAARTGAKHYFAADYEDLAAVHRLANQIRESCDQIDVLANNAGGIFEGPQATKDGFERTFQVNHLSPYLLTHELMDLLLAGSGVVVNTSSVGAKAFADLDLEDINTWEKFTPTKAYGNSKLANILFSKALHQHFQDQGLAAVAFHPGIIATNFAAGGRTPSRWLYQTPLKRFLTSAHKGGTRLVYFVDGRPGEAWRPGEYYSAPGKVGGFKPGVITEQSIQSLWDQSAEMLGLDWGQF